MNRRRLTDDPFPPPPGRAHGPAECMTCRRVKHMHASGACHWCGGWVTETDAASVAPGDLIFDFLDWETVTGVSRDGDTVRIVVDGRGKPWTIGAASTVWVSTEQREAAA